MTRALFFHLKTTGDDFDPEIIQISAKYYNCPSSFNQFMYPNKSITDRVEEFIKYNGRLYLWNLEVPTRNRAHVLLGFIQYMQKFKQPVVLAAHKVTYHGALLMRDMKSYGLYEEFTCHVAGFCDTVKLLRTKKDYDGKFSIPALTSHYLKESYPKSSALGDVILVNRIMTLAGFSPLDIIKSKKYSVYGMEMIDRERRIRHSLRFLNNYISHQVINTIVKAGIPGQVMKEIYSKFGDRGLVVLLKGYCNDLLPVTLNEYIIEKITQGVHDVIEQDLQWQERDYTRSFQRNIW